MAYENLQLRSWILKSKLGSGACADVYDVESAKPLNKHDEGRNYVAKVCKLPKKGERGYKDKLRNVDSLYSEYLLYRNHIANIDGVPKIPLNGYGEDKGLRFLIIEKMDTDLLTEMKRNGSFSSSKTASYGMQAIKILKQLHQKNILYTDFKPDNLMISNDQLRFVDFGITDKFITCLGKHKERELTQKIIGTPSYLSIDCHKGWSNGRKDDIEALLFVLIFLIKGSLPWEGVKSDQQGADLKENTPIEELCKDLHFNWVAMFNEVRRYKFEEKPDYEFFENAFAALSQLT